MANKFRRVLTTTKTFFILILICDIIGVFAAENEDDNSRTKVLFSDSDDDGDDGNVDEFYDEPQTNHQNPNQQQQRQLLFSNNDSNVGRVNPYERIVTEMIFMQIGVPVDFSYNETNYNYNAYSDIQDVSISAPGCPRSIGGRPWIYYGSPPKCFLTGFKGPCPWGKRLYQVDNSKYGVCNCDCFALPISKSSTLSRPRPTSPSSSFGNRIPHRRLPSIVNDISQNLILPRSRTRRRMVESLPQSLYGKPSCRNKTDVNDKNNEVDDSDDISVSTRFQFGENKLILDDKAASSVIEKFQDQQRYQFCHSPSFKRLVIYDKFRQECFPVLDQGPCQKGEWVIRNPNGKGIQCERRKCTEHFDYGHTEYGGAFAYFDYIKQECVTDVFGSLQEINFSSGAGVLSNRTKFCKEGGMKYSHRLKTCVKDVASNYNYKVIG